ncbi:BON domain-containing protein [Alphaproteobacteria bacterium]|jgi:osmotically-inducible protein OsmY|nr:BON domain-containing protein [Alphaproteobacteria bacterium]
MMTRPDHALQSSSLGIYSLCLLCVMAIGLSGCVGAVAGVGAAAVAAGTTEKGLSTSISDSVISTKISESYFQDDVNLFSAVTVDVNQGSVLLTGAVIKPEDAVKAVQMAWQVHGVIEVINELDIQDKSSIKDRAKDIASQAQLRGRLITDLDISSLNFSIDVVNGVVYLSGIAGSEEEMNRVVAHAQDLRFGTTVVNYIRINEDDRQ